MTDILFQDIKKFVMELTSYEDIVLAGHTNPDGDAICSCFAFGMALEQMGKKPKILLEKFNDTYDHVKGHHLIYTGNYDELSPSVMITLDCADLDRLGDAKSVFNRSKKTICIDHHISNTKFAEFNMVDEETSSTSQLVYEILLQLDIMDRDIAIALYTGIVFDTAGFKHNCTTSRTHEIAGKLLKQGIDTSEIHTRILYSRTLSSAKLLSKAIQNVELLGKLVITTLSKEEILVECGATYDDLEGISAYFQDLKEISVSVFMYERGDGDIKVSFRSKSIDVNKIASKFGGGGHVLASGAKISELSLIDTKKLICDEVQSHINL